MKHQLREFIFSVGILDINIYIVEVMFNKLLFYEKTLRFYNTYYRWSLLFIYKTILELL